MLVEARIEGDARAPSSRGQHRARILRNRTHLVVLALSCIMAALTVGVSLRRDLWVDEMFSLAIATGHSLEHPAAVSEPAKGDFVESPVATSAEAIRRYAEHDPEPAGIDRVLR